MTKVIAINGSPRKGGNTAILIRHILEELENEGETELVQLAGAKIRGCTACMKCFENRDRRCVFEDDAVNDCIEKMATADGIVLGSPVYFSDVTAELKALIDRAGFVSFASDGLFTRNVGVSRRRAPAHRRNSLTRYALPLSVQPGHHRCWASDGRCREGYRRR